MSLLSRTGYIVETTYTSALKGLEIGMVSYGHAPAGHVKFCLLAFFKTIPTTKISNAAAVEALKWVHVLSMLLQHVEDKWTNLLLKVNL